MIRGRRPVRALDETVEIVGRRGSVEQVTGTRACACDFIIIEPDRNVFVKVKRSRAPFTYTREVMNRCQREIASLHQVPLTNGTFREFWVRSPHGTWQFFLVRNDSVQEIPADGVDIRLNPFQYRQWTSPALLLTVQMTPYLRWRMGINTFFGPPWSVSLFGQSGPSIGSVYPF